MDFSESDIFGYPSSHLTTSDVEYLNEFWMDASALETEWADVLNRSFDINGSQVGISRGKRVDIRMGGVIFLEQDFEAFNQRAAEMGVSKFCVIEDVGQKNWKTLETKRFLRFSFPIRVPWARVAHSCALSEDVFTRPIRAFFVVTHGGEMGKYTNADASMPYELCFN